MAWWNVGDKIAAVTDLGASPPKKNLNDYGGLTQAFRGLRLRTHPDADVAASKVLLVHADEIVMDDGTRLGPWDNLVADITVAGAGGLDTGAEGASRPYETYAIAKDDGTKNLLLHRAPNYASLAAFTTTPDAERALRLATGTATDRLAQGLKFSSSAALHFVKVKLKRTGAVSGRIWFSLQADSAGNPSGTALATTDKIDAALISTSEQQILLIFRTPTTPSATPTQYHLVLEGDYTRSDTVFIAWRGVAAGGYADGSAKENNGTTWSAASGVGDFNFDASGIQNNTAVTMPTGYTKKALIHPHAYNDSGSNLVRFTALDRLVTFLSSQLLANTSVTIPTLLDLSAFVPPGRVVLSVGFAGSVDLAQAGLAPVPDGFGFELSNPLSTGSAQAQTSGTANDRVTGYGGRINTEYQSAYFQVSTGTGRAYLLNWEWN